MKKIGLKNKFIGGVLALVLAVAMMPAANVKAEEVEKTEKTYTITYRPGDVGKFGLAQNKDNAMTDKVRAEEAASAWLGTTYDYEVTEKGAIKVKVPAGNPVPDNMGHIIPNAGYFVKQWGPAGEVADRNMDFVVDYGRLVDGVAYTIKYVDESNTNSAVSPYLIKYANIGDEISVKAPQSLVLSDATRYTLVTTPDTVDLKLDKDATKNIIEFHYRIEPTTSTTTEIVNYTDGGTVTTTDTYTTYRNNGTTTTGAGAAVIGGGAAGNAGADAAADEGEIIIPDEDTALDGQIPEGTTDEDEEQSQETVTIDDGETALAAGPQATGFNVAIITAGLFGGAAIIVACVWLLAKKRNNNSDDAAE